MNTFVASYFHSFAWHMHFIDNKACLFTAVYVLQVLTKLHIFTFNGAYLWLHCIYSIGWSSKPPSDLFHSRTIDILVIHLCSTCLTHLDNNIDSFVDKQTRTTVQLDGAYTLTYDMNTHTYIIVYTKFVWEVEVEMHHK